MIGSISGLRDATETRAITHIMTKAPDKDKRGELEVEDFVDEKIYQEIRNELYLFAWQNWDKIEETYKSLRIEDLKKRDLQLWKPLLAIAKNIDKELFSEIHEFAKKISEQRKQDFISEGTLDYKLLKILKDKIEAFENKIYLKDVSDIYNDGKEKKIAPKTISSHLDKIGFKEYREKDRNGSYLNLSKEIFEIIVAPIIPDFSSYSSQSSQNIIISSEIEKNKEKTSDEDVTKSDEYIQNNKKIEKLPVTNVTKDDEYDEYIEVTKKLSDEKNKNFENSPDFSELNLEDLNNE
jgi:fido (protein-threonine AMPylation protein)